MARNGAGAREREREPLANAKSIRSETNWTMKVGGQMVVVYTVDVLIFGSRLKTKTRSGV